MALYKYTARDMNGSMVSGNLEAPDEASVIRNLQSRNFFPVKINRSGPAATQAQKKLRRKKVKGEDLSAFCHELAVLLNAGVKIIRALELLTEQVQSQALLQAVRDIRQDIEGGLTFSKAVAKHPKVFPDVWIYIVEAGEVSGHLPGVLNELGRYLEMIEGLKKKVVSAMMYPSILMSVAIGAILFFMLKVIPIFANLFNSFKADLPFLTMVMVKISNCLIHYFWILSISIGTSIYLLVRFLKTAKGKRTLDVFLLNVPVLKELVRDIVLTRIAVNMSVLIKSGVDFIKSLEIVSRLAGNSLYQEALEEIKTEIKEGKMASEAFGKSPLFTSQFIQMIQIGEESGKLEEMLYKLGEYYEARVNVFIGRINVLIEPIILLFVGATIGIIVVSMFLPIFNLGKIVK